MRIGIDIGGTFTDFVFFDEETGTIQTYKTLSTPHDPAQAVSSGLLESGIKSFPSVIHGSTVATNALLERKGSKTALITTCGFRDVLAIGRQNRSNIYDFGADRPEPLVPNQLRLEVKERVNHQGRVLERLNRAELPSLIAKLRQQKVEAVAVCLLFSFIYPDHERQIAKALAGEEFFVSTSYEVLPEFREYERTSSTVINAYVSPVLDDYLGRLQSRFSDLRIMQSNGGSIQADVARKQGIRTILSGPAGGVVGAKRLAENAGTSKIITFDMGGTSTDVSLCDGKIQITTEAKIGGLPVGVPVIDIHTVGAGGGSIAYIDAGGALRVGPQSAGADPGPVCYGKRGVQPTVTDANLVLGRLAPDYFLGGQMALDQEASYRALAELAKKMNQKTADTGLDPVQTAALGVVQVANAHMERALRVISVERGYDPQDFTLVSFGGAGGLHAGELARLLGIKKLLIPKEASTLSAFGMLTADCIKDTIQTVMLPDSIGYQELMERIAPIVALKQHEVQREGIAAEQITIYRELDLRYKGQSYELTMPLVKDFIDSFHAAHQLVYGHSDSSAPVEIVNLRLRAVGAVQQPVMRSDKLRDPDSSKAIIDHRMVVLETGINEIPFYHADELFPGNQICGPAVIVKKDTTILLESGNQLYLDEYSNFIISLTAEDIDAI